MSTDLTVKTQAAAVWPAVWGAVWPAVWAAILATLVTPVAALAQGATALPPDACTLTSTVQGRSCLTVRYWTCPDDAPGHHWSGLVIEGVEAEVNLIDATGNPVLTHYIEDDATITLTDVADPVDLPGLIATGADRFDYVRTGDDGRPPERYVGQMQLMGRLLTVDGQDLPQVLIDYEVFMDGAALWKGSAVQYLSPDSTALFYGNDLDAGGAVMTDFTPIRILAPGVDAPNETCEG